MRASNDTVTEAQLRDLFSMEPDDGPLDKVVGVCAGEWRQEGADRWRFWADESCCERTRRIVGAAVGEGS